MRAAPAARGRRAPTGHGGEAFKRPRRQGGPLRFREWFWPAIAVLVALNVAYAGWAVSHAPHREPLFYLDLQAPATAAGGMTPDDLVVRMQEAGWSAALESGPLGSPVSAFRPTAPDFTVWFRWSEGRGWVGAYAELSCTVSYLGNDCPQPLELRMRAQLDDALAASGLPFDAAQAHFGDNDFADWTEFGLRMGQLALGLVSLVVALVLIPVAEVPGSGPRG